jgi:hypothetical protein
MGVGSGVGGQFGWVPEVTYGTPVAVTKFLPVTKASPKLKLTYAQGVGIAGGQLVDSASQRLVTIQQGTLTVDMEVQSNALGLLLQTLMGTTVTPVQQGASAAYLQTHTLADPVGKFLSCQTGIPDTTGTVRPYTATGCKVVEADFSFDINSTTPVMSTWTIDAQNVVETQAIAAFSPPANLRPFVGTDVTIKVGTFGSEASVDGVVKVDVKIPRPMKTTRFYFGNQGLKREPLTNARPQISGTITADYVDKTIWADRFASHASFSMVIEAKGPLIASTYYQTFRITLPGCFIEGDTPDLASEDVVNGAFPFVYRWDGTNLPKIEYISTDVTL